MSAMELSVIGSLGDHAVEYARHGMEIFPVDPASKRPMAATGVHGAPSQYGATTDVDHIAQWWQRWPGALIGHRLPEDVIVIDIDPRYGGRKTWQLLRETFDIPKPTTRSHISGGEDRGGHLWFRRPAGKLTIAQLDNWAEEHGTGHKVANADRWVCGLDLLHRDHRYTILPPSPHPETGEPYRWNVWGDVEVPHEALTGLLVDQRPPPPPREPKAYDGDSIADWYTATYGLAGLLHRHGWSLRRGSGDDDGSAWQHPHATAPISATVKHGCLFTYSPNTPFDVTEPGHAAGVTPFKAFAILEHGGDMAAAAKAARILKDGERQGAALPGPVEFQPPPPNVDPGTGEISEPDAPAVPPVVVHWADDETDPPEPIDELVTNLVARGELTVLGAPRAMGKTWATMQLAAMCAEGDGEMWGARICAVTQPATVAYLQGELGRAGSYGRWRLATAGRPPHVAEVFERLKVRVTTTRTTSTYEGVTTTDEISRAVVDHRLEPLIDELGVDLLIIDPWATYYSGSENSNDETEAAIDALTQMVRRVDCAGWIVHHITAKATHGSLAEPEDLWRGASRLADAVATRVTMLPHYSAAKAKELGMDRFAARRFADVHIMNRNAPPVPVLHSHLDGFAWTAWEPPDDSGGRPAALSDQDVLAALREHGDLSKSRLAEECGVSRATIDRHIKRLSAGGEIEVYAGPGNAQIVRLEGGHS